MKLRVDPVTGKKYRDWTDWMSEEGHLDTCVCMKFVADSLGIIQCDCGLWDRKGGSAVSIKVRAA